MKPLLALSLLSFSAIASTPGYIRDFNYTLTDAATKGVSKEVMFKAMVRDWIDLNNSICANRAHLWAYDIFRNYGLNTGKIFIFFGRSLWKKNETGYMYHVAPYILENGTEYVMEASYDLETPLTIGKWIENETEGKVKGDKCQEITAADEDLTEYFYDRYNLPEKRANGLKGSNCYFRKVPGHYSFPSSIAMHDLKRDYDDKSVNFNPTKFDTDEVLASCTEAASSKVGRVFGSGKAKCKKHLRIR